MKKRLLIGSIAALSVFALAGCQQPEEPVTSSERTETSTSAEITVQPDTSATDSQAAADQAKMTGVMMKDGKMMTIWEGGETMMMDKDVMMMDGSKVMMDGSVIMKDGTTKMMKEGETMMEVVDTTSIESSTMTFDASTATSTEAASSTTTTTTESSTSVDKQ